MIQKIKCPHCGEEIWSGNFCSACGGKLVKVCDCAFLGEPFDCGYDKCPGVVIHRLVSHSHSQKESKKEKPPEGGKECKCEDMTARLDIAREIAQTMFKAPD